MIKAVTLSLVAGALAIAGCEERSSNTPAQSLGGNPAQGKAAVERYGCAGCHLIPGLSHASSVGPPLAQLVSRNYVGGVVVNSPENLVRWIKDPQSLNPRTAMPTLYVTDQDARDIATYLYTLR
jgi:cytochrome c1